MTPTKQSLSQHNLLHQHFPDNCCLCKKEQEISQLKDKLQQANDTITNLTDSFSELKEKKDYELEVLSGNLKNDDEEIKFLKDKLHRRNMMIANLKKPIEITVVQGCLSEVKRNGKEIDHILNDLDVNG